MIVSYFTDNYFKWALLFLESYKMFNGEIEKIHFNVRCLKSNQMEMLRSMYSNLVIVNRKFDMKWLSEKYGVPERTIKKSKEDVEAGKIVGNHRLWMDITSVHDRMVSFLDVVDSYYRKESYFVHIDIDVLFRANIQWLIDGIMDHEVALIIRGTKEDPKIAGGLMGIKSNDGDGGIYFLEAWIYDIEKISPIKRVPMPYQQIACNSVYKKYQDCDYWKIPYGQNKLVDSRLGPEAAIWLFKTKKKWDSYDVAKKELERMKNVGRNC